MSSKKTSKLGKVRAIVASFLVLIGLLTGVSSTVISTNDVYAVPNGNETTVINEEKTTNDNTNEVETTTDDDSDESGNTSGDNCKKSLGALGWVVCPSTGKISEAVDWLYDKIEQFLVVSPISTEDGSPIYEIWKYCRGITNIVFIIFLLVVIYSQITGLGISNYGIKKALPKLIVTAVLVNLSFLICSLAVDVSNIVGNSLRGVFTSIEESTLATSSVQAGSVTLSSMFSALVNGGALTLGAGAIAFEFGMIWMLIPIALGAIVAVVTGLITIALRQAVVALLIMISPLAMVAYMLPNTEQWFKKWKDLLTRMLVFYPMFSLLFGASSLAGFAIIMSAKDGFGLLLGVAVQIFPLFFAWKLMQMSGTFLGGINAKLRGIADKPLAVNREWANSHRANTRAKYLASEKAFTPSLKLMQFMNNRKVEREADTAEYQKDAVNRGLAYRAGRNYKKPGANGAPTKRGMKAYARQAQNLEYNKIVERDKNTMNKGLGYLAKEGTIERAKLDKMDERMVNAADTFKMEQARGEKIEYENAMGFHKRMDDAMNAHMDMENGFTRDKDGKIIGRRDGYKFHMDPSKLEKSAELARYNAAYQIMEGNVGDVQYAVATAAQGYDTQKKIYEGKMQKYFELTAPTQDVVNRMNELTVLSKNDIKDGQKATANIDAIVAGMRILNQRGDTDLLKAQLDNLLDKNLGGGVELGTHASQSLASFLMFEVKGGDPALRRFGKYINLETARMFNESGDQRQARYVTYDEYLKGYHEEPSGKRMYAKKDSRILLEGTSLDDVERTAFSNLDDSLKKAYGYKEPKKKGDPVEPWDVKGYLKRREELQTAMEPAFLSSSLKWLSGSEQINSGVKFWTGYEQKQKKDKDGNLMVDDKEEPIYELTPVWKGKEFAGHEKEVEEYYRKKTEDYFKDQTTGQILNMRTDYREPAIEHLLEMYFNDEGADEEPGSRRREYERERAEIQTRYGDEADVEVAKDKRNKDMTKLRRKIAGEQLRKILDGTGKLETIYTNRRSGATINAKDWLRQMLNLDDKEEMYRYLNEKDKQRGKKKNDEEPKPQVVSGEDSPRVSYSDSDKIRISAELGKIFDETGDYADPDEGFYNESLDKIEKEFGSESIVVKRYKEYKKYNNKASRSELKDELDEIISSFYSDN